MRHGREQAELIKACAAKHGMTTRGVRKWREAGDPRWDRFLAERALAGTVPVGAVNLPPEPERNWTDEELAMDSQIRNLKIATADLRERAELAKRTGDLDSEMTLRRMWLQHTESLRRLEKDAPSIQKESGDVLPRRQVEQALIGYVSGVKSRLALVPDRIFSLFPDLAEDVVGVIRSEVDEVMRSASQLSLTDGAASL